MANQPVSRTIYVAFDFGTTFSAIAWGQSARPDVHTPIMQWPNANSGSMEGVSSEKCPTELIYDLDGKFRWGFQIKENEECFKCFKSFLDPEQVLAESELARKYPDPKALSPKYSSSAEGLVVDYFTALRTHVFGILRYKLGQPIVNSTPFSFIVTVPAIWSPRAMERTRACAKKAGLGERVRIISEPEAAAIHSLDMMDPHGIKIGERFVVCDAGGGTVDLITYVISKLKPTLTIREAIPGKGNWCGGAYLNRIFQKFLETKFQHLPGWDDEILGEAMERFEKTTKRTYTGDHEDEFIIPLAGLKDDRELGIRRGKYRMSGKEVGGIFAPVVKEVIALVQEQVTKSVIRPKAILLVGGFGQSSFLRDEIRRAFPGIDVTQPANGWTSVVRGALMRALAEVSLNDCRVSVTSRVARKFYGLTSGTPFDATKHESSRKYWSDYHGHFRVKIVRWLVNRGDQIKEKEPVEAKFHHHRLVSEGVFTTYSVGFYSFAGANAPLYEDSGAQRLVKLTADLSSIPKNEIHTSRGKDGKKYYDLSFEIKTTFFSAHTDYSLWYDDQCYGSVAAEYA